MRLMVLSVMGLIGGLGLAAAIVSVPVMAEKGPLRATLVAHLGGGQEKQVPGGGDPDGEGRAVVKVFKEQLCGRVKTADIESSSKATINLGMSGEKGPTVANLQERAAKTPLAESTTPTISATTGTTGTTTGTTTATTGPTGAQQTGTTTTGDTTSSPQATTTQQSTTVAQSSPSQSTASPTASASASASASTTAASTSRASTSRATNLEHTGGCVEVPRALSLELLEHPRRFYVNVTNEQYPEGAIRGQLHQKSAADHRSGAGEHRSGNDDD
jgi:CHRD domain